jgi:hypothetical protein
MDIWVRKHSMRRNGERTTVLYFITPGSITKSEPDSRHEHLPSHVSDFNERTWWYISPRIVHFLAQG